VETRNQERRGTVSSGQLGRANRRDRERAAQLGIGIESTGTMISGADGAHATETRRNR